MNKNLDIAIPVNLPGDLTSILRAIIEGIADKVSNPVVRESVITAADVSLLRQRPAAAILPEEFRRQTIGTVLDEMMQRVRLPRAVDGAPPENA